MWLLVASLFEAQSGIFLGIQVDYFDNMIITSILTPCLL